MIVSRFAPSPNGPLHLGHAYSAIAAQDLALAEGGKFLLRIEDIDGARSRPDLPEEFRRDLAWLGLDWEEVAPQSARIASYEAAAERLKEMGLLYPCICTRAQIAADAAAAGAPSGPDGPLYPGTCRATSKGRAVDPAQPAAWRLDMTQAVRRAGPLEWLDRRAGMQRARPELFGDVVLWRKDAPASYHLAATLDDAADGVTLVTRGMDLFASTHVHRLLQALLGLPVPRWYHHGLLVDAQGRKLAKRRGAGLSGLGIAQRRLAGEDGPALADALRAGILPAGISLSEGLNSDS